MFIDVRKEMTLVSQHALTLVVKVSLLSLLFVGLVMAPSTSQSQSKPSPPSQPTAGPGGSDAYRFSVQKSTEGQGGAQYHLFEPQGLRGPAPVIAFLHGWSAVEPTVYQVWIDHLVKRGNIVVFPVYQAGAADRIPNMTPNAIQALRDAFSKLGSRADSSRFALAGHSLGGLLAFNIASQAGSSRLPVPKAIMAVQPGDSDSTAALAGKAKLAREGMDYQRIPRTVHALVVVGEEDETAGDEVAKFLFSAIKHVPCENKNYVVVRSDRHGTPELVSDHTAPATAMSQAEPGPLRRILRERVFGRTEQPTAEIDALDYYGFWKLLDGLTEFAFQGRNRDYALGGGRNQTFMGRWSDGRAVQPLLVSNDPACRN
jgi:acetyl esterase/lipase